MKTKLLTLACCLAAAFTAQAQTTVTEASENKIFKPVAGDITTEVSVNLEQGTTLNRGQLRGRKFMADNKAFRLSVGVNSDYRKFGEDAHRSYFSFSIAPGIEKHFAGTNRLSPYIGAELPVGYGHVSYEDEDVIVRNADNQFANYGTNFNVGLRGLAGVDFYVVPRFYIGFEVGAGATYYNYADVTTTYKKFTQPAQEKKGYHSVNFSPFANGGIRVGFAF